MPAALHVIVDNHAEVWHNGSKVGEVNGGWLGPDYSKIAVSLVPGNNRFDIVASNTGNVENAAGLLAALKRDSDGQILLKTDKSWKTSSARNI